MQARRRASSESRGCGSIFALVGHATTGRDSLVRGAVRRPRSTGKAAALRIAAPVPAKSSR